VIIVEATSADFEIIRTLAQKIWTVSYKKILPPQQIAYMLDLFYSDNGLRDALVSGHQFLLLVDRKPLGFAGYQINHLQNTAKLHKLYILPDIQRKGYGKRLLQEVIHRTRMAGNTKLQLNVNRYNDARLFYERFGFTILAEEDIHIGHNYYMEDYVMACDLISLDVGT
jgi:GNAT superfamily N-acetyltransferase